MALQTVAQRITATEAAIAKVQAAIDKAEQAASWSGGDFTVQRGNLEHLYKERARQEQKLNTLYLMQRRQAKGKRGGGFGSRGISFQ